MDTSKELTRMCISIADTLKDLYNGDFSDEQRQEMEANGEAHDLYSYFSDVLDFEFTISSKKDYLGVKARITLGGPNIWVDTRDGEIKGAWGSDRTAVYVPRAVCDQIDSIFAELYYI